MNSIESRRSIRKYKPDTVAKELIDIIVNAARLAPSAKNRQPWKYIAYISAEKNKLLEIMESSLIKEQEKHYLLPNSQNSLPDAFNTLKIMKTAPAIIIVVNTNGHNPF